MGQHSKIEWTHHTFNPWWGCVRISPGCKYCYADTWARRIGMELWGKKAPRRFFSDAHWKEPLKWNREAESEGMRRRVFCASMADVFENRRDLDEARARLWPLIESTPWLDWLLLTKRPEHIARIAPWKGDWPTNIWLGTTAEDQKRANQRIPEILKHRAVVHFASCEPLLAALDLTPWLVDIVTGRRTKGGLSWVIAGGESGAKARPMNPDWAQSLRDQCEHAGTPFHFKQWGHWVPEEFAGKGRRQKIDLFDRKGNVVTLVAVGKHAAGRSLFGEQWDGFPLEDRPAA
jgi:protein gp37